VLGPPVTVSGGPPSAAPRPAPRWPLGLAVAVALLAAGLALRSPAPPPPPPPEVDAVLRVVGDRISQTRTGTLVVPVEVVNTGPALRLDPPRPYVDPALGEATATGATRVPAGGRARFVVVAAPDCRLLQPGSVVQPSAAVSVTARAGERTAELRLDLDEDPDVRAAVAAACRLPLGGDGAP
jgi:hypothetical protein